MFSARARIVLRAVSTHAIHCHKVVDEANYESEYTREQRKKAPVNKASQEPGTPAHLLLSNFLQTLQEREVLNCFYTPLPA